LRIVLYTVLHEHS